MTFNIDRILVKGRWIKICSNLERRNHSHSTTLPEMWTHNCVKSGMTATLRGEPCNWCDVTEEDVMDMEMNSPHDILEDPNGTNN